MIRCISWRKSADDCAVLLLLAAGLTVLSFWLHLQAPAWKWTKPAVEEVEVAAVENWQPAPLWVDARSTASYEERHIPGAVSLNETAWEQLLPGFLTVWQPNSRVVVYCDSHACDASQSVALRLKRELRLTEIYVLKDGWTSWQQTHPR